MKFGICTSMGGAAAHMAGGFDYTELSMSELVGLEPFISSSFSGLGAKTANLFLPGGISLWDSFDLRSYAQKAVERAEQIGLEVLVIGSGRQRSINPEEWPPKNENSLLDPEICSANTPLEGFAQAVASIQRLSKEITLAPESLNRTETNVGVDSGELALALADAGCGYTADSYHLLMEWDANGREGGREFPTPGYWTGQIPHRPVHVHLGDLQRKFPMFGNPMMAGFFDRLGELGYSAGMSLECPLPDGGYSEAIEQLQEWANSSF